MTLVRKIDTFELWNKVHRTTEGRKTKMANDYSSLLWKIGKKYGTQKAFCTAAGVSENTLSNYIKGKTPMPSTFIAKACELLAIPTEEIGFYFFRESED